MAWINYHSHNEFCDGKLPIEDHVRSAIEKGMPFLGISSHAPVPFNPPWSMRLEKLGDYITEITRLKNQYSASITIFKSLEVDYIPGKIAPNSDFIRQAGLDYVIGSLHFLGEFDDGTDFAIDGPTSDFTRGFNELFHRDIKALVKRYFELSREMITGHRPDVVGHIDKIKMHNRSDMYFNEQDKWYREEILKTLETVREKNIVMEVNTRGMYKKKATEPYPSAWVLAEAKQMNIPVLVNSDSHTPEELTREFETVTSLLIELGFSTQRILTDSGWQDVPFDENGIIF